MDPATSSAQLLFQDSDRQGTFAFDGRQYPVTVLNLPSVVESYKTLDDVNLVKTTDIGQVCLWAGMCTADPGAQLGSLPPQLASARCRS